MSTKIPSIDMTPMVDLAFLLVTFFMLTAQFRPEEPVQVETPRSSSDVKIPESNLMTITVDEQNRVYFDVDGQEDRKEILIAMSGKFQVAFNDKQVENFMKITTFGVPMADLPGLLSLESADERKKYTEARRGIPVDSTNNELDTWIRYTRIRKPEAKTAVKGDGTANYETIKKVIGSLANSKVYKFSLVTMTRNADIPEE